MNHSLPQQLFTAEQVRKLDHAAISEQGIAGFELMRRAGKAAYRAMIAHWHLRSQQQRLISQQPACKIQVFCGGGNNGGDGYIVAGLAAQAGFTAEVVMVVPGQGLKGDAFLAYEWCQQFDVVLTSYSPEIKIDGDILVDALLGTGLSGVVRDPYFAIIERINAANQPVLAIDIPSGLCADSGSVLGAAIKASLTVSFIGMKRGLLTGVASDYCGELVYASLNVPDVIFSSVPSTVWLLTEKTIGPVLLPRSRCAHKGHFGHLLIIGGSPGMAGAVTMAAEAALSMGVGLVSVGTLASHAAAIQARTPEVMVHAIDDPAHLEGLLADKTAIVIGPGLGRDSWGKAALKAVMKVDVPLLVDADGLNLMAQELESWRCNRKQLLLTPHPGEASRLLGESTQSVQHDRFAAVSRICKAFNASVVLKGAGSLVSDGEQVWVCPAGNPGMASGGMGDVLSGMLGAFLAIGLPPCKAAKLGVWLHATAADVIAAEFGEWGLRATELIPEARHLLNQLVTESEEQ
ncbi:NAD(P)H-hydrate dehydratase [Zooshikella ganghwensis]|uniref:Bifunctional NAD(P)H-hydrate repair enzyme n=1 Tax=Zooshikella ganghwensis TaxID=202772 RepID=A0A4P9VHC0_9GAMM|nr:NAD(P)H-hydrate dehydratase [Zooshikella ganghwensis]RDH42503.1 NAD(P)H-hydrate dehydratase [Zooshikella ganghwensis]